MVRQNCKVLMQDDALSEQACRYLKQILWEVSGPATASFHEDCLQEASLCIWLAQKRIGSLPENARLAFAMVCARRAALRYLRREVNVSLKSSKYGLAPDELLSLCAVEQEDNSSDGWLHQFLNTDLTELVQGLSERDRSILHLVYAHGCTAGEVAMHLQCSEAAVDQQRRRLLSRLRRKLKSSPWAQDIPTQRTAAPSSGAYKS